MTPDGAIFNMAGRGSINKLTKEREVNTHMDSNITINIVEPGSSTPIEPVVPNTGLFTSGIGGAEAAIIATISLVVILAIVGTFIYYKKKQHHCNIHYNKCCFALFQRKAFVL